MMVIIVIVILTILGRSLSSPDSNLVPMILTIVVVPTLVPVRVIVIVRGVTPKNDGKNDDDGDGSSDSSSNTNNNDRSSDSNSNNHNSGTSARRRRTGQERVAPLSPRLLCTAADAGVTADALTLI